MSIKTELDRISQAKNNIVSELKAKYVDVPADVRIDDIADIVKDMEMSEDLSTELNEQNTLLATQTNKLNNVISALSNKAAGSGEDLTEELTSQDNLLTIQTSKLNTVIEALEGKAAGTNTTGGNDTFIAVLDGTAESLTDLPSELSKIKPYAFYHACAEFPKNIYQAVEYIENVGNSWINTGITAKPPLTSTINGMWKEYTSGFPTMLGSNDTSLSSGKINVIFGRGTGGFYIECGTTAPTYVYSTVTPDSNRHTFVTTCTSSKLTISVDGASASANTTFAQHTNDPLYLFARGIKGGTVTSTTTRFRLYSFTLINDSELVWDAVPCYRKSDGEIGLYNKVDGRFYENIGTVPFVKGADIELDAEPTVESADLSVTEIGACAFTNNNLYSLVLRSDQVVSLGDGALDGTPIANGTGTTYVPSELVNSYKTDNNWSIYANQIKDLSELEG